MWTVRLTAKVAHAPDAMVFVARPSARASFAHVSTLPAKMRTSVLADAPDEGLAMTRSFVGFAELVPRVEDRVCLIGFDVMFKSLTDTAFGQDEEIIVETG